MQEIVLLIQRSEEYNTFMLSKVRAALADHFAHHQQQQQGGDHHRPGGGVAGGAAGGEGDAGEPIGRRGSLTARDAGAPPDTPTAAAAAATAAEAQQQAVAAMSAAEAKYRWAPRPGGGG